MAAILDPRWNPSERSWGIMIVGGMAATGAAFGFWRAPEQALISAVKMPFMMLSTVWLSAFAATMLAWLLGLGHDFRQVRRCILAAMAASSVLLASLSPIILFLAITLPDSSSVDAFGSYRILLGTLVASVGCAGLLGAFRLHRLLMDIAPSHSIARRTLAAWIVVMGLVGTQTSWLLSPFVQRPTQEVTFWNPLAFQSNFFEYLWSTLNQRTIPEKNP